jgi:hypothetical protein
MSIDSAFGDATIGQKYLVPGTVVQNCNSSFSGSRDQEDLNLSSSQDKMLASPYLDQ